MNNQQQPCRQPDSSAVSENIKRIAFEIGEAKAKYRSQDDEVRIMAVTKTVPAETVNEAIRCGITLLGENRVQEYLSKKDLYLPRHELHFIGHLQTNKVKYIADSVDMIQSVDSLRLAEEINRLCKKNGRVMDVLIEVNIGGEESKSGVAPEMLEELLYKAAQLPNISVKGLMCIPPAGNGEVFFSKMKQLHLDISAKKLDNINMSILSMGMSGDYAEAVRYGSTLVRIGTKLFGARI